MTYLISYVICLNNKHKLFYESLHNGLGKILSNQVREKFCHLSYISSANNKYIIRYFDVILLESNEFSLENFLSFFYFLNEY